jgi:hypothetical protein
MGFAEHHTEENKAEKLDKRFLANLLKDATFFLTLLDLTDVCPLLTMHYIQVGLQIQYMFSNF